MTEECFETETSCFKIRMKDGVMWIAPKERCSATKGKERFKDELRAMGLAHSVKKIKLVEDFGDE